jgi:hypothetical protein
VPTILEFSKRQTFTDWLLGLGIYNDEDDDAEAHCEGLGERTNVGQEYQTIALAMKNILLALKHLCLAGQLMASKLNGSRRLHVVVEDWFSNQFKALNYEIGGSVKAAMAVRSLQIVHHLDELMDVFICLKSKYVDCSFLLEKLFAALGRRIIVAETEYRAAHSHLAPGCTEISDFLIDTVIEPVLLHSSVAEIVRLGFMLAVFHLLAGSRPGWILRLGSTLSQSDAQEAAIHKLRGSISWKNDGFAEFVSSGDKTRNVYGTNIMDCPDTGNTMLFLCELTLLAVL